MTTEVTTPVGRGAPAPRPGGGPPRPGGGPSGTGRLRGRRLVAGVVILGLGAGLVVGHERTQAERRAAGVSLAPALRQLHRAQADLAGARRRLARARDRSRAVSRPFDVAEASLSSAQAEVARDDAGISSDGVDRGRLDDCVSRVEQALNQLAVGQTAGGLSSLRASSSSCAGLGAGG